MDNKDPEKEKNPHWLLWVVVAAFITLAIGGMWAIDYLYAPEMISEGKLPEAVGK